MKTFANTTRILSFSSAAALGLLALAPAQAESNPIVVESQEAMAEWQADVNRSLNNRLYAATSSYRSQPESGIVQVRFTVDAEGNAQNIELIKGTGDRSTDRVAERAVSRVSYLDEAPVRDIQSRTFQANIIFARNHEEHDELKAKLAKLETARLALADEEEDVILLGG